METRRFYKLVEDSVKLQHFCGAVWEECEHQVSLSSTVPMSLSWSLYFSGTAWQKFKCRGAMDASCESEYHSSANSLHIPVFTVRRVQNLSVSWWAFAISGFIKLCCPLWIVPFNRVQSRSWAAAAGAKHSWFSMKTTGFRWVGKSALITAAEM